MADATWHDSVEQPVDSICFAPAVFPLLANARLFRSRFDARLGRFIGGGGQHLRLLVGLDMKLVLDVQVGFPVQRPVRALVCDALVQLCASFTLLVVPCEVLHRDSRGVLRESTQEQPCRFVRGIKRERAGAQVAD